MWKWALGAVLGGVIGGGIGYCVGCADGACAITGSWPTMSALGVGVGLFMVSMIASPAARSTASGPTDDRT